MLRSLILVHVYLLLRSTDPSSTIDQPFGWVAPHRARRYLIQHITFSLRFQHFFFLSDMIRHPIPVNYKTSFPRWIGCMIALQTIRTTQRLCLFNGLEGLIHLPPYREEKWKITSKVSTQYEKRKNSAAGKQVFQQRRNSMIESALVQQRFKYIEAYSHFWVTSI